MPTLFGGVSTRNITPGGDDLLDDDWTRSMNVEVITVTGDYTIEYPQVVLCDCSSGNITLTVKSASGYGGRMHNIKKIDSSANTVTISGGTIDGSSSLVISSQYSSYTIVADSNSGKWYII